MKNTTTNLYKVRNGKLKGNKTPQEVFYESTNRLFRLLSHHPFFIENVTKIRNKHRISNSEVTNVQKLLEWKNSNRLKYSNIINDQDITRLIDSFDYASELKKSVKQFTFDFIMTNNLILPSSFETGLNIIRYSKEQPAIKLNPKSVYLEITPYTTERELKSSWEKVVGKRKEIRNYGVPNFSKIEERIWELSYFDKLKLKPIAGKIKEEGGPFYQDYEIAKMKSDYKSSLSKLKPIK